MTYDWSEADINITCGVDEELPPGFRFVHGSIPRALDHCPFGDAKVLQIDPPPITAALRIHLEVRSIDVFQLTIDLVLLAPSFIGGSECVRVVQGDDVAQNKIFLPEVCVGCNETSLPYLKAGHLK